MFMQRDTFIITTNYEYHSHYAWVAKRALLYKRDQVVTGDLPLVICHIELHSKHTASSLDDNK